MLDPKSIGVELNQVEKPESMEYFCNLVEYCNIYCFADLAQYRSKEGVWNKSFNSKAAENKTMVKKFCDASQDDISRNDMPKDIESSLTERELEDIEPVASNSGQTNDIEFINIEHVYDTDSNLLLIMRLLLYK
ncbi:unnamed protein product [Diatraea saccharalis]|uniref:Uncharacterized protein n=1 Tax=Diatraea saccharalis TaxID=40085 RepID=A0A9N9RD51_9NEOP|nr:unnamed protein product [Diatraea saccharalis]